jgi:hypothetical protein
MCCRLLWDPTSRTGKQQKSEKAVDARFGADDQAAAELTLGPV